MKPYRKAKNMANSDGATRFAAILSCMPNVPGIHVHKFHSIVSPWKWDVVWHASDSDPECRLFVPSSRLASRLGPLTPLLLCSRREICKQLVVWLFNVS